MELLLIDPPTETNVNVPNIGLAYAATYYDAPVIDQHILPYPKQRYLKHRAELLGISVKSLTYPRALEIRQNYTRRYPESQVKSVTGFLDVQCCYPYLGFDQTIHHDETFSDRYPFPRYELFDSFIYLRANWQTGFWGYPIMTSQGCPYACRYCASRLRKWRPRSAENCFEELKRAKLDYGITSFEVFDDAFNIDKQRVLRFCELITPLNLRWKCANGLRADLFDAEMARAMASSGCYHVGFGIETIDPSLLRHIKKGETGEQIEAAIDVARKLFKNVYGFVIIGLPGSDYLTDIKTLNWVKQKQIRTVYSYYLPLSQEESFGNTFYGSGARPLSDAYPAILQKEIYRQYGQLRKSTFLKDNLLIQIFRYTLKALPLYDRTCYPTHFMHLLKRFTSFLTRGEVL